MALKATSISVTMLADNINVDDVPISGIINQLPIKSTNGQVMIANVVIPRGIQRHTIISSEKQPDWCIPSPKDDAGFCIIKEMPDDFGTAMDVRVGPTATYHRLL